MLSAGVANAVALTTISKALQYSGADYENWASYFKQAVNRPKEVATIFIVGNEPTIEPPGEPNHGITSSQYANAFNSPYADKVAGVTYLAAGPAAWDAAGDEIDTEWLSGVSNKIDDLDGWALHTYGSPYLNYAGETADTNELCDHANVACPIDRDIHKTRDDLIGDAGFLRYQQFIEACRGPEEKWAGKPVYITETNTHGYNASEKVYASKKTPAQNYPNGWIQETYEEIRRFNNEKNADRGNWPRILCLCWFVDSDRDSRWAGFALANNAEERLQQARADFKASNTTTSISPGNPTSNLAPWIPIIEDRTGTRVLSGTIS